MDPWDSYPSLDSVYVDDDFDESTIGWQYNRFNSIQDGVDAVDEGGTVYVYNGTYYENLVITKGGINLLGEDKNTTIIDAGTQYGNGIKILNCDYVTVSDFTIRNANHPSSTAEENGIHIRGSCSGSCDETVNYNTISNCNIYNNANFGIYIAAIKQFINMNLRGYYYGVNTPFFSNTTTKLLFIWPQRNGKNNLVEKPNK